MYTGGDHPRAWRVGRWIPTDWEQDLKKSGKVTFSQLVRAKVHAVKYVLARLISQDTATDGVADVPEAALDILGEDNDAVVLKTIGRYFVAGDFERAEDDVPVIDPKDVTEYKRLRKWALENGDLNWGWIRVCVKKKMPLGTTVNSCTARKSITSTETAATTETPAKVVRKLVQRFLKSKTFSGAEEHDSFQFWTDAFRRNVADEATEAEAAVEIMLQPPQQEPDMVASLAGEAGEEVACFAEGIAEQTKELAKSVMTQQAVLLARGSAEAAATSFCDCGLFF